MGIRSRGRTTTLAVRNLQIGEKWMWRLVAVGGGSWQGQWQLEAVHGSPVAVGGSPSKLTFPLFSGLKRENRGKLTKTLPLTALNCHLDDSVLGVEPVQNADPGSPAIPRVYLTSPSHRAKLILPDAVRRACPLSRPCDSFDRSLPCSLQTCLRPIRLLTRIAP
jgi:hypothetical protein